MADLRAEDIRRGLGRYLMHQGWRWLPEVTLPTGRRVDVMGINAKGKILVVEIKSSLADFQSDSKWQEYLPYCDAFGFCVSPTFPSEVIPDQVGLLISDSFSADMIRPYAEDEPLNAARRKALTLKFAQIGAARMMAVLDPDGSASWGDIG